MLPTSGGERLQNRATARAPRTSLDSVLRLMQLQPQENASARAVCPKVVRSVAVFTSGLRRASPLGGVPTVSPSTEQRGRRNCVRGTSPLRVPWERVSGTEKRERDARPRIRRPIGAVSRRPPRLFLQVSKSVRFSKSVSPVGSGGWSRTTYLQIMNLLSCRFSTPQSGVPFPRQRWIV